MSDVETVSTAIDAWLRTEVVESNIGRNQFLDSYEQTRRGLALPSHEPDALDALKSGAHFVRYKRLLELIDVDTLCTSNLAVGKLIHHSLMFTSGGFRLESFLGAHTQAEYRERRFGRLKASNGATSAPITEAVNYARTVNPTADFDTYMGLNREINDQVVNLHGLVHGWSADNPTRTFDALSEYEMPVRTMRSVQSFGIMLAASHAFITASLRGIELGDIPVLEPKSISDAQLTTLGSMESPSDDSIDRLWTSMTDQ